MGTFGNIANGDILKLNIGLMLMSSIIIALATRVRKLFKENKKKAIIYALFVLATFALAGLLSSSLVFEGAPGTSFVGFQIVFLLLGILHIYVMRKYFPGLCEEPSDFFAEFLFTLAYVCLGLIVFSQIVNKFRSPFSYLFLGSSLMFLVPFFTYKLYEFAVSIPVAFYESWKFPTQKDIKDPTSDELANPRVISFEFMKTRQNKAITNFRVKAPKAMRFGRLFYFFLMDYNERHPENPVEIMDAQSKDPSEWIFYFKPNWYSSLRHIDITKTVDENGIKENTVIICKRVG